MVDEDGARKEETPTQSGEGHDGEEEGAEPGTAPMEEGGKDEEEEERPRSPGHFSATVLEGRRERKTVERLKVEKHAVRAPVSITVSAISRKVGGGLCSDHWESAGLALEKPPPYQAHRPSLAGIMPQPMSFLTVSSRVCH
jgi:hypothetical protein